MSSFGCVFYLIRKMSSNRKKSCILYIYLHAFIVLLDIFNSQIYPINIQSYLKKG